MIFWIDQIYQGQINRPRDWLCCLAKIYISFNPQIFCLCKSQKYQKTNMKIYPSGFWPPVSFNLINFSLHFICGGKYCRCQQQKGHNTSWNKSEKANSAKPVSLKPIGKRGWANSVWSGGKCLVSWVKNVILCFLANIHQGWHLYRIHNKDRYTSVYPRLKKIQIN